jgi:hypothetical protein
VADDPATGAELGKRMGRHSCEEMHGHWNDVGGPVKDSLNRQSTGVILAVYRP